MTTFKFFADAGMTVELTTLPITVSTLGGVSEGIVYFGSTAAGKIVQAATSPGVDPVTVTAVDADTGAGYTATAFKLALSALGLDSAVGGAALTLGTSIASGTAIAVFWRFTAPASSEGVFTDLSLTTNQVVEA